MKKSLKERQIEVLKTDVKKWNRYMRFCFCVNIEFKADLSGSNLRGSNLSGSDLSGSDLSCSDLRCSNLRGSNLSGSDLSFSDLSGSNLIGSNLSGSDLSFSNLRGSNLSGSDLSGSNLDMASMPLWCGSLKAKFDLKLRIQIGFHFASLIANGIDVTDEEKEIYAKMLDYVNKFHRTDVERLNQL